MLDLQQVPKLPEVSMIYSYLGNLKEILFVIKIKGIKIETRFPKCTLGISIIGTKLV